MPGPWAMCSTLLVCRLSRKSTNHLGLEHLLYTGHGVRCRLSAACARLGQYVFAIHEQRDRFRLHERRVGESLVSERL